MKTFSLLSITLGAMLVALLQTVPAQAQATRTWVSGTGLDSNPCSRTAPCKTFAGAISQTLAGGEISVLDSGGYGAVTINKAITINGEGTLASILSGSGAGITIAAAASDRVIIRNISINGTGGGTDGIFITSGHVTIDKCFIYGFQVGFLGGIGINVATTGGSFVDIRDTNITNSSSGILMQATSSFVVGTIDNVRINDAPVFGVAALNNSTIISIRRSFISNTNTAVVSSGTINVDNSELTNNVTAVNAQAAGAKINLNNNSIYDNTTGFAITAGGTIATGNNNKTASNGGATVPNATLGNQ
jgi:hypothetical protein